MEPVYWIFLLGIVMCGLLGSFGIMKARRRREPTYYWVSGICFLLVTALVAALLKQFLLSFAMMGGALMISIGVLPRIMELNREEIVKQKQETDVSAPLQLKDFLTLSGWIKLRATHGLRKTLTLYILTNMEIVAAVGLVFVALGLMNSLTFAFYAIFYTTFSFIISYRQVWKALKDN